MIVNGVWPNKSLHRLVSGRRIAVVTLDVVLTVSTPIVIVVMMVMYGTRNGGHRSGKA